MRKEIQLACLINFAKRKNVLQNIKLTKYLACLQHRYQTKEKKLHLPTSCFAINSRDKKQTKKNNISKEVLNDKPQTCTF